MNIITYTTAVALLAMVQSFSAIAQEKEGAYVPSADEFINSCSSCHGMDGEGAGFLTRVFKGVNPGDLTQLAKENDGKFPFDEVFQVIDGRSEVAAHGERKMPVWGDRYLEQSMTKYGPDLLNEYRVRSRVLELINYLQSIQKD